MAHAAAPERFQTAVHSALQNWHKTPDAGNALERSMLVQEALAQGSANLRQTTNRVLQHGLDLLAAEHPADARLLEARFRDEKSAFAMARELNIAESTLYNHQRRAVSHLAEILWGQEQPAAAARRDRLSVRLPPAAYTELVGVEAHIEHLSRILTAPEAPWLVAIEGLGGLGKTTLAHATVRHLAGVTGAFADYAWVSAQQQTLVLGSGIRPLGEPALTTEGLIGSLATQLLTDDGGPVPATPERALAALVARLHRVPSLIVVDNLETVADVETLLPTLARLVEPTKFLLTSRQTVARAAEAHHFAIPELPENAALRLIRNEAQLRGLQHVANATDAELQPLYAAVGGNPLALRLVTGQCSLLTLAQIIANLREARGKQVEALYRFIYWEDWRLLSEDGRNTLLLMPLFAQGGADLATIGRVSELSEERLLDALGELERLSLVSIDGDLHSRRYSIHRLTESFLLKEVLKWQFAGEG